MLAMFADQKPLVEIIRSTRFGVDVAPTGEWLAGADKVLAAEVGAEFVLRNAVQKLPAQWDMLIMDCPPSLGLLSVSALAAADEVTDTTKLSKSVESAMRSSLGDRVFAIVVRKNVKVAESYSHKRPITDYAPKSPGTADYDALATELIGRAA